jgi:hypothetical protein
MKAGLQYTALLAFSLFVIPGAIAASCSATGGKNTFGEGGGGEGQGPAGPGGPGSGGNGGDLITVGANVGGGGGGPVGDPTTCAGAAQLKSYIGCDFWPTPVGNMVWSIFDYAVVVANAGDEVANVTVTQGGNMIATATVPPNDLAKIYLPWVPALKGPDFDQCTYVLDVLSETVRVPDGAYHLTSSRPVTVYQFNALEYGPQGGPAGKDWSQCPSYSCALGINCYSYSNDASLLLPSTTMTGNYRITSYRGWTQANMGAYFAITGTQDGTTVQVKVSGNGQIMGGGGVPSTGPNGLVSFPLNQGEVVEVVNAATADPSGSLVYADKPVQVISGIPCVYIPDGVSACDHLEESVFPAETLGKHYFVTVPTSPGGGPVGHVVRIFGNVNGTMLSYPGEMPPNAPLSINAGQVVELGQVSNNFEIVGDHEFAVAGFQLGSSIVDPGGGGQSKGDPAQSLATAVEQYRDKYVFLAPDDYDVSYVDVVQPLGAAVTIDGTAVTQGPTPISSNYGIVRVALGPGKNGAHVLTSTEPVGIQVMGYGDATSYQYPGGSNLASIAPPPPPPN